MGVNEEERSSLLPLEARLLSRIGSPVGRDIKPPSNHNDHYNVKLECLLYKSLVLLLSESR